MKKRVSSHLNPKPYRCSNKYIESLLGANMKLTGRKNNFTQPVYKILMFQNQFKIILKEIF